MATFGDLEVNVLIRVDRASLGAVNSNPKGLVAVHQPWFVRHSPYRSQPLLLAGFPLRRPCVIIPAPDQSGAPNAAG
jgi:hypothetical protein